MEFIFAQKYGFLTKLDVSFMRCLPEVREQKLSTHISNEDLPFHLIPLTKEQDN